VTPDKINRLGIVAVALFTLLAPWILPVFVDEFWVDVVMHRVKHVHIFAILFHWGQNH